MTNDYQTHAPRHVLENSDTVLIVAHSEEACQGRPCTIHNPTDHHMRGFRQQWNSQHGFMERVCPHGIAHPDPDEYKIYIGHICDECCFSS